MPGGLSNYLSNCLTVWLARISFQQSKLTSLGRRKKEIMLPLSRFHEQQGKISPYKLAWSLAWWTVFCNEMVTNRVFIAFMRFKSFLSSEAGPILYNSFWCGSFYCVSVGLSIETNLAIFSQLIVVLKLIFTFGFQCTADHIINTERVGNCNWLNLVDCCCLTWGYGVNCVHVFSFKREGPEHLGLLLEAQGRKVVA